MARGLSSLGPALYGVSRALQDTHTQNQQDKAFDLDQISRQAALDEAAEMRPRRLASLDLALSEGQAAAARRPVIQGREDQLFELNKKAATLNAAEADRLRVRLLNANKWEDNTNNGLRGYMATGDPQPIADSIAANLPDLYPKGIKAERQTDEEGNEVVMFSHPGSDKPLIFRPTVDKDQNVVTVKEQLEHFATKMMDPARITSAEIDHKKKLELEGAKTERALDVEDRRTERALSIEDRRAKKVADKVKLDEDKKTRTRIDFEVKRSKSVLDAVVKTKGVPGSWLADYANPDFAVMRGVVQARQRNAIEAGSTAEDATNEALASADADFSAAKMRGAQFAAALAKKKINPRKPEEVKAAADKGDADATELLRMEKLIERQMGPGVARYWATSLPAK